MQRDDFEIELACPQRGLHQLGLLPARGNYLRGLNTLKMNARYVSNLSIGFRLLSPPPHKERYKVSARFRPYTAKERYRTKSENNDLDVEVGPMARPAPDPSPEGGGSGSGDDLAQLKKAKSLESIIAENNSGIDLNALEIGTFPELEVVSNSIQNLKVAE